MRSHCCIIGVCAASLMLRPSADDGVRAEQKILHASDLCYSVPAVIFKH
jgi:hypothetical protein